MQPPPTRYAHSGDVNIAYQVLGDGPIDVVHVPGFVSNLEMDWQDRDAARYFRRLASFSRPIMFDKRGTGLSDRIGIASLEDRMDDVRAVMDAVGSERATVFGSSEGGAIQRAGARTAGRSLGAGGVSGPPHDESKQGKRHRLRGRARQAGEALDQPRSGGGAPAHELRHGDQEPSSTRSRSSSPECARLPSRTAFGPRSCSPTSWTRPRVQRRSVIEDGASCSMSTMRSFGGSSNVIAVARSIRRATGFSQRSMAPRVPSAARPRSAKASPASVSPFAPGSTPANAN